LQIESDCISLPPLFRDVIIILTDKTTTIMTNDELTMNANPVVAFLQKPSSEFTKADIIRFIEENNIRMVNFMYPGGDGRLKTLNFTITNLAYLDTILTCGERVDGSSLFSFIEASSSDLYVIPRLRTAFVDPFAEIPTLSVLCSFFNKDGQPLESAPEHTLAKASRAFTEVTGMEFHAMGELEFYVIIPNRKCVFPLLTNTAITSRRHTPRRTPSARNAWRISHSGRADKIRPFRGGQLHAGRQGV
jgi:glutamine synthetase